MAATDLFNSNKGQYANYTTLIGGTPPDTSYWFLDSLESLDHVSVVAGSVSLGSSGGISPTGGVSTQHEFKFDQKSNLNNFATVLKFQTGNTVSDFKIGLSGRRVSAGTSIIGRVNNSLQKVEIVKRASSVDTVLSSSDITALQPNRTYWVVVVFVGNIVRCEHWTTDPRLGSFADGKTEHTLTGADITTYSVTSQVAVANWVPIHSAAKVINIETGYAFADNSPAIKSVVSQRHVNIRDFTNYRYPVRYRTIGELNTYHINQKAFSQIVRLDATATGGTFNILFYATDQDPYIPVSIGPFAFDASSASIKSTLNAALNALPKYSLTSEAPIKNVINNLAAAAPTLQIEFSEMFGDLSLLQINTNNIQPPGTATTGPYDPDTGNGTFSAFAFDSLYIQTGDPLNYSFTIEEMSKVYRSDIESWVLKKGFTGTSPPEGIDPPFKTQFKDSDVFTGKIRSRQNRKGLDLNFGRALRKAGQNWSVFLQSVGPVVNCSKIGKYPGTRPDLTSDGDDITINISFADFPWYTEPATPISGLNITNQANDPTLPGCFVQFTSAPDGSFSGNAVSNPVAFANHLYPHISSTNTTLVPGTADPEFIAPMSEFLTAYNEFDFWNITGVRIFLCGASGLISNPSIKIMGIRSVYNAAVGGDERLSGEINTIEEAVLPAVLGYNQIETEIPPMIRGDKLYTIASDPSPIDSQSSLIFQTGAVLDPTPGVNNNTFMLFARETEVDNNQMSSWLTAEFVFKVEDNSSLKLYKTKRIRSDNSISVPLYWDIHPGGIISAAYTPGQTGLSHLPLLNPETNYEISMIVQGNTIAVEIYELTSAEQPDHAVYISEKISDVDWVSSTGRVGWYAVFGDKDMYISSFALESSAYAILRTKPFQSETAVEGAQLFTVDSGNKNLFENFFSLNSIDSTYVDYQKSLSGSGSFAFQSDGDSAFPGIISNQFTVNDWSHLYIEFDIWVPAQLKNSANRPKFLLRPVEQPEGTNGLDVFSGVVPNGAPVIFEFIAGAWSHVSFEMRGTKAKSGDYYLVLVSDGDGDAEASSFRNKWWIDNIKINMQTVEWEMRVSENGLWAPFRNNVNKPYGGLHLPDNQIGKYLQLQARALSEDAWISEYTVFPKYVSMGRLIKNNLPVTQTENIVAGHAVISSGVDLHDFLLKANRIYSGAVARGMLNAFAIGEGVIESSDFYIKRPGLTVNEEGLVLGIGIPSYKSLRP